LKELGPENLNWVYGQSSNSTNRALTRLWGGLCKTTPSSVVYVGGDLAGRLNSDPPTQIAAIYI
jgi:hypothetical protein